MTVVSTTRPQAQRAMSQMGRLLERQAIRSRRKLESAQASLVEAHRTLYLMRDEAERKFGRLVPLDGELLDVLSLIDVEDSEVWRWRGMRNNKNLATVKINRIEVSAVRYLAIKFGLIDEADHGTLYPMGSLDDVNPWHRKLRRSSVPIGRTTGGFRSGRAS